MWRNVEGKTETEAQCQPKLGGLASDRSTGVLSPFVRTFHAAPYESADQRRKTHLDRLGNQRVGAGRTAVGNLTRTTNSSQANLLQPGLAATVSQ